jgi:hypothetical protein
MIGDQQNTAARGYIFVAVGFQIEHERGSDPRDDLEALPNE